MLDEDDVLRTAARFGVATLTHGRAGWLLEVQELHTAELEPRASTGKASAHPRTCTAAPIVVAEHDGIHPMYRAAIERCADEASHEGALVDEPGCERVECVRNGVSLALCVDPTTHCIRHAAFQGAPTGHRGLMERFCALLEGVPLLDAADHGVQRLELALREHWAERPVPGIVTPRAADPCFELPLALIRGALVHYRARTGYAERVSTWDPGPGAAWKATAAEARQAAIRSVLDGVVVARGGAAGDVQLLAIEFDVRLVLRVGDGIVAAAPQLVFELERALRDSIDPRLEVVLEEIRDRNRLRRLAVVE
jgi:hypothetical protein